ncbi:MAG: hypothetical protein AAFY71_26580 [Bacteroidota bacterium]
MAKSTQASSTKAAEAVIIQQHSSVVSTLQVDVNQIPDLSKTKPKAVNLAMEYWTPKQAGESKTLVFMRITKEDKIPDFNDPSQLVSKDCVYFIEQTDQGLQILRNASSRMVSIASHFIEGEVYRITFKGMLPNKTNNNKSHHWAIQPVELVA